MKIEQFLRKRSKSKNARYRTANIDSELHLFLKRTAGHYNITLSNLMINILSQWKNQYEDEIKKDMLNDLSN